MFFWAKLLVVYCLDGSFTYMSTGCCIVHVAWWIIAYTAGFTFVVKSKRCQCFQGLWAQRPCVNLAGNGDETWQVFATRESFLE